MAISCHFKLPDLGKMRYSKYWTLPFTFKMFTFLEK